MSHPDDLTLQSWASGDLDDHATAALERHVDRCELCARRLTLAARQELGFVEVATAAMPPERGRWLPLGAGVLLVAATALLWVGQPADVVPEDPATATFDMSVDCTADADGACWDDARTRGLMLGGEIPRYETNTLCFDCGREQ